VLLLPQDLLVEPAGALEAITRRDNLGRYPLDRSLADPDKIEQAARLLAGAKNPLIVAGGGVHISGAHEELAQLQDVAGIPVATTVMGKGAVDERHALSLGVIGYFMGKRSRTQHLRGLIDAADVVLFVGDRTNQNGTDSWTLFPQAARYIHIDVDSQEIGRNYEALRLAGDAKLTLAALTRSIEKMDLAKRRTARASVESKIAEAHKRTLDDAAPLLASDAVPIRPERLMRDLDALLDDNALVVSDASYAPIWCANYLTARRASMRFLAGRGLAGLGWGLPAALGAKLAAPGKNVFCVTGDGGFAHVWAELESAKRLGIAVTVVVLNNQILGYQQHAEDVLYGGHTDACALAPVDHAAIARACGCEGVRIERPADFAPALKRAMAAKTTTVLDVIIDPKAYPPLSLYEGKLDY
jgi:acetolactate synthase-1/2/3 large subunit